MKKILSKDGTAIAVERTGRGPALVFVDGAMCYRASGPSQPMAAALAEHFTVFTYDRRGRGDSSDSGPYDIQREVDDLDAVIREAGGQAVVLGVSSGAALALEAASRGVPITRLALYEAPFIVDEQPSGAVRRVHAADECRTRLPVAAPTR
jgi:pimeloyl-ACP methyl ester carboxylesterase